MSPAVFLHQPDLYYVPPDDSGQRVCTIALQQLSYCSVKAANLLEASGQTKEATNILMRSKKLVDDIKAQLKATVDDEADLPSELLLSTGEPGSKERKLNTTQFASALCWEVERNMPDPGQAVKIGKYIPINFMQIPQRATTRRQAIEAIRLADFQCTHIDCQDHCIKNQPHLIFALIEHLFTQVIPVPKPRGVHLGDHERHRSERAGRRDAAREEAAKQAEQERELQKKKQKKKARASGGDSDDKEDKSRDSEDALRSDKAGSTAAERGAEGEERKGNEEDAAAAAAASTMEEPDWTVGTKALEEACAEACIWDAAITYELQVEVLLALHRLMEHFVAAAMSITATRTMDAVCIVVPGCICAISDAVLRRRAVDEPGIFSSHLMGMNGDGQQLGLTGFGISLGTFATDAETMEVHYPELNIARTAVLDYFNSPQQKRLEKVFHWEQTYELRPGKSLVRLVRNLFHELAHSNPRPHLALVDGLPINSFIIRNIPEFKPFRDMVMWWKYLLNPDPRAFVNHPLRGNSPKKWGRMSAQLTWQWDNNEGGYQVTGLQGSERIRCRPDPKMTDPVTGRRLREDELPKHRWPSAADPAHHVSSKPPIRTEDDVIYRQNLPGFGTAKDSNEVDDMAMSSSSRKAGPQVLGQRDSELLLSILTVPYLRPSLCITFFASDDRVHKLQSTPLRNILDSCLFEPGRHLALELMGVEPTMIPTQHQQLLATTHGLLLNELHRSPETVIRATRQLIDGALALDTGSVCDEGASDFNTSVDIILYATRLAARVENYISFLVLHADGKHDCIDRKLRDLDLDDETLDALRGGLKMISKKLRTDICDLFEDYLKRLDHQTSSDPKNEKLIARNARLACDLHAHKLLLYRNITLERMGSDTTAVTTILASFVYLTTRHSWNKAKRSKGALLVPEHELYEVLQVTRRRMVQFVNQQQQYDLDKVMQTALQVSASSTGSMRASAEILDAQNRWSRISGSHSVGRYAVASTRTVAKEDEQKPPAGLQGGASDDEDDDGDIPPPPGAPNLMRQTSTTVGEVADNVQLGVEMDLQIGQMTLRSKHLSALETKIATHPDVQSIFGDTRLQVSRRVMCDGAVCFLRGGKWLTVLAMCCGCNPPPPSPAVSPVLIGLTPRACGPSTLLPPCGPEPRNPLLVDAPHHLPPGVGRLGARVRSVGTL